jgi:hypothetical protein
MTFNNLGVFEKNFYNDYQTLISNISQVDNFTTPQGPATGTLVSDGGGGTMWGSNFEDNVDLKITNLETRQTVVKDFDTGQWKNGWGVGGVKRVDSLVGTNYYVGSDINMIIFNLTTTINVHIPNIPGMMLQVVNKSATNSLVLRGDNVNFLTTGTPNLNVSTQSTVLIINDGDVGTERRWRVL